jgi:hypothetical protein
MSITAMRQALDAMEYIHSELTAEETKRLAYAILDLVDAIDEEPVAWVGPSWLNPATRTLAKKSFSSKPIAGWIPLYTR